MMREAIGRYRVTGQLGEGGMGVVYDAWDERLGRAVAVKTVRTQLQDPQGRERFWREARAAGALSHPNICHIYEIGEDGDELFIAMERLEGESLAERIRRGPLPPQEAATVALGALSALEAVHARGLLHRDLKPSNVYLTPHGVKLLDFGLALPVETSSDHTLPALTLPGVVLGTPGYMAPEQILGQTVDVRSDLYAVGAVLYEMVAGAPPFRATAPVAVLARVLSERPAALSGSPAVIALDRIIQRAMTREPQARHGSAAEMAQDLRDALRFAGSGSTVRVETIRRLIVLPIRLLRADPEIDFLSFGLADAVTASLSNSRGLVVRSSLAAAKYTAATPDLRAIGTEADVDLVLSGTLLRAGDQLRLSAQLLTAPLGTLLWSHTVQAALTDLFQLQDDLARRIVDSVSRQLAPAGAADTPRPEPSAPRGRALELYLRANQFAFEPRTWMRARELYEAALAEDDAYAPAWARVGRLYRVLGKYGLTEDPHGDYHQRARQAFDRALALAPDLSLAIAYAAQLDIEQGRSREAMVRLLETLETQPDDPHLLVGLVGACRYCGLVEASIAAHQHVRRLDRVIATGIVHSYFLKGDYERAVEEARGGPEGLQGAALAALGREQEALAALERDEERFGGTMEGRFARLTRLAVQLDVEGTRTLGNELLASAPFIDPEALYHGARILARIGDLDDSISLLEKTVAAGFCALPAMTVDGWLDPLRGRSAFRAVVDRAETIRAGNAAAFSAARGERLLGVPAR